MAVKQSESFAAKLQAIIDAAPALRAAGVTSVGGDVAFTIVGVMLLGQHDDGALEEIGSALREAGRRLTSALT